MPKPREVTHCPWCGAIVQLTTRGRLHSHTDNATNDRCEATGKTPLWVIEEITAAASKGFTLAEVRGYGTC